MKTTLKIGITGGIGSGKSTVAKVIETLGYPVFYADQAAKDIMESSPAVKAALTEWLGSDAILDNQLNKPYIASRIFSDAQLKGKINNLVHPLVREAFRDFADQSEKELVFMEAAILFETGSYQNMDKNILVVADEKVRINRVTIRDNVTKEAVQDRMKNQWSDQKKIPLANFIIENNPQVLITPQVLQTITHLTSV
ncbi:MAG: dephospho-CoA kinase [Crocinitomicaceae bacterium]|nr:dephospho-CoA kinase [Crocinitomicaceae bacterium]